MAISFLSAWRILLSLTACITLAPALAQPVERLPSTVARALQTAGIPKQNVAVIVQDVTDGAPSKPHVRVNPTQAFNPASLMKLLTTYAALELLGPGYTWKTEAWIHGKVSGGVLQGDLVLKGSGDPKLTFEQFWLLLRQLRARGLREIHGDLVLDRSRFDNASINASSAEIFDDQPLRPYNVTPDALLLNFKTLRLQLMPNPDNQTLVVLGEPQLVNLDIINLIRPGTLNQDCGNWKDALHAELSSGNQRTQLLLSGVYPPSCGEKIWHLGVLSHPQYVEGVFRQLWQDLGGTLTGSLREATLPAGAQLLASSVSPPLSEVLRDINKFSNNVMARQLFLTIGAEYPAIAGRNEGGAKVIRTWLQEKQLDFPEMVLENGSGLSRHERLSADSLTRLLLAAWQSPLMPEFLASLPLSAIDGTMKHRLNLQALAGQAHVKTGSLEGVKTIAGYVHDQSGRWHIVVFLVNHANAAAAQPAQDALLRWVYNRGARGG
ncbi:MAG: D-alanyl-D-alanine carboxypeptidase/D-alanyl-D-alanine-endopeptidase [Betaproteobacteria bacterium]|nr:D-alanyl-D-alanine carboxypeptidase/D-alanyl-D-alanine-endopeptidase [Betaproteobacteria bacterium]